METKGNYMFEVRCDLFERNPKGGSFHIMDKWWLIDTQDFLKEMPDPVIVKVTLKRFNYIFDDKSLD